MAILNVKAMCILLGLVLCSVQLQAKPNEPLQLALASTAIDAQLNLFQVNPRLFRSEQLQTGNAALFTKHNIRTVINLRFFDRDDDQEAFGHMDVLLVQKPLKSWSIKPKEIADVLYEIQKNQQHGAVLVHCYHGADRTGLIIGMSRIVLEGWDIERAKQEMMQGPYGFHSIWKNIPNLYNEDTVRDVKIELARLKAEDAR